MKSGFAVRLALLAALVVSTPRCGGRTTPSGFELSSEASGDPSGGAGTAGGAGSSGLGGTNLGGSASATGGVGGATSTTGGTDAGRGGGPSNPCDRDNGGCDPLTVCTFFERSVVCGPCPEGYVGDGTTGCAAAPCASSPCTNGGRCVSQTEEYACDCPPGVSGERCENTIVDLAGGRNHLSILLSNGAARSWSYSAAMNQPSEVDGPFTMIDSGDQVTCGLSRDGTTECWGTNAPVASPPSGPFTKLSVDHDCGCGLLENGSILCWGRANEPTLLAPPSGAFVSLSVGWSHACAIADDGTAACWGANDAGQSEPPTSRFRAVACGSEHTCGLTLGGTIECWGAPGHEPPSGTFSDFEVAYEHTCAVRMDGAVVCWGPAAERVPVLDGGPYIQVATGGLYVCGLRPDHSLACTGQLGQAQPPDGTFIEVDAGDPSCALRRDGSLECWSQDPTQRVSERGPFTKIASAGGYACALSEAGAMTCWGYADAIAPFPEDIAFSAIGGGGSSLCAIVRADRSLRCWGADAIVEPPAGEFQAVAAQGYFACALDLSGVTRCWGTDYLGSLNTLPDSFSKLDIGELFGCGMREDGRIRCWGFTDAGQARPPSGEFLDMSAGSRHGCGIRIDGTVACWGRHAVFSEIHVPPGWFTRVSAGVDKSCGIRTDGTLRCWGVGFY